MSKSALIALCIGLVAVFAATAGEGRPTQRHAVPPYISVTDLTDPVQAALKAKAQGGRVIVVFDIDNTLLTVPQDLGGDSWFNWQKATAAPDDAAFSALIAKSNLLLQATSMRPTQPDAPALIGQLQAAHIPVYALSARSPEIRGATEAALKAWHMDLSAAPECGPPLCTRRGNLGNPQIRQALFRIGLKPAATAYREITVSDGVMMVSGQDKGMMLNLLLRSLAGRGYSDVYFVDDTLHNIENVQVSAPYISARVHPYSYERYWPDARAFKADAQRQAKAEADYSALKASLCAAVAATLCGPQ